MGHARRARAAAASKPASAPASAPARVRALLALALWGALLATSAVGAGVECAEPGAGDGGAPTRVGGTSDGGAPRSLLGIPDEGTGEHAKLFGPADYPTDEDAKLALCRCAGFWMRARTSKSLRDSGYPEAVADWAASRSALRLAEDCESVLARPPASSPPPAGIFNAKHVNAGYIAAAEMCASGWEWQDLEALEQAQAVDPESKARTRTLAWTTHPKGVSHALLSPTHDLVNMLPETMLTSKDTLASTLRRFGERRGAACAAGLQEHLVPQTFVLSDPAQCAAFASAARANVGAMWILKPAQGSQGKGLAVWRSEGELDEVTALFIEGNRCPATARGVAQRYIAEPLLLGGKKFDLRMYAVVVSVEPLIAYYARGHARVALADYDPESYDRGAHLTNTHVARQGEAWSETNEDHAWSLQRLLDFLHSIDTDGRHKALAGSLEARIRTMAATAILAGKETWDLDKKDGAYFQVIGFDFMIDSDLRLWLIEGNKNPLFFPSSQSKETTTPSLVRHTLRTVLALADARIEGKDASIALAGHFNGTLQPLIDNGHSLAGLIRGCGEQPLHEIAAEGVEGSAGQGGA